MQLDKDNAGTEEIGPDVAWGTLVKKASIREKAADPFQTIREGRGRITV